MSPERDRGDSCPRRGTSRQFLRRGKRASVSPGAGGWGVDVIVPEGRSSSAQLTPEGEKMDASVAGKEGISVPGVGGWGWGKDQFVPAGGRGGTCVPGGRTCQWVLAAVRRLFGYKLFLGECLQW